MSNRNFNKQTTNARQGLAEGGTAKGKLDGPKRNLRAKERKRPGPSGGMGPIGRPKSGPKSFNNTDTTPKPKNFDNTDKTDREKIIKDRILNNKIKDKLKDKPNYFGKDKPRPQRRQDIKGTGRSKTPKPTPRKPSPEMIETLKRKKQQADYMKKHGKNEPRRKTLSVKNTYKKEVEGLKK